jgi:hypothetical protein
MNLDGNKTLELALENLGELIAEKVIAQTAFWIAPTIYHIIKSDNNPTACFFPGSRRAAKTAEVRTTTDEGIYLDSNERAIKTMRQCTGRKAVPHSYTACHIYEASTRDVRYFTCVANIVWVPAAISSLTDGGHKNVSMLLKRKAYELYDGFHIGEIPPKPPFWDEIVWPDVQQPAPEVIRRIQKKFATTPEDKG